MDRRKHERFSRRVQVRYWPHGQPDRAKIGYTKDLSEGGVFLITPKPLKKGSRLQLEVEPEGPRSFFLEALVARSVPVPRELQAKGIKTSGMGLRFLRVRELLRDLMPASSDSPLATAEIDRSLLEQAGERDTESDSAPSRRTASPTEGRQEPPSAPTETRTAASPPNKKEAAPAKAPANDSKSPKSTRSRTEEKPAKRAKASRSRAYRTETWPDRQPRGKTGSSATATMMRYPVSFPSLSVFLSSWERDLRFGGLFVSTNQPAALDSEVELELQLPESDTVLRVRAQVVHIHETASESGEPNLIAGMGVVFENAEVLAALQKFAESMR